jgi:hypothetical protein
MLFFWTFCQKPKTPQGSRSLIPLHNPDLSAPFLHNVWCASFQTHTKSAKSHAHSASHSHRLEVFQFEIDSLLGFWFAFNCKLIHCTHTHTLPHYCNITVYSQPWNQSIKSIKPAACILLAWRMSREIAVPSPKTTATLPVELEAAYDAGCSWQVVFSCQTAL